MPEVHYNWGLGGDKAIIQQHSIAKHEVLRAYLVKYLQTLVSSPRQEVFRLTLVDGFAGGGVYRHATTGEEVLGSPFVMLEAVKEAEYLINQSRRKKVHLLIDYFFIEQNPTTVEFLKHQLIARGYQDKIGESIFILNARFQEKSADIVEFIKNKGRAARAIFLLDQYGYKEVPAHLIRSILKELQGSEVILTFAVDSFLNYAGDNQITRSLLERIGVPNLLRGRTFEDIKRSEKDWRLFIQGCLYRDLVDACGAGYYTPFFIRSTKGHGDYWLLHLSQRHRARDVMTSIHWEKNNYFIHYGDAGLDMFHMLGYSPEKDVSYTRQPELDFGFCFDEPAKKASIDALSEQIPELIYPDADGMSFGELFASTCNKTPASAQIYREAIEVLIKHKVIEVISPSGSVRRSGNRINDNDQVLPPKQCFLFFN